MAKNTGVLNRVKKTLPTSSLLTIYNSLILSHLCYGLEVWGATFEKNLKRIKGIQKKAIRIISKSHWLAHSEPRMKKLKLLKLPDQHRHQCLSLMFNMTKGIGPNIYDYQQRLYSDNANHNLRSVSNHPNNIKLQPLSSFGNKRSFPFLAPSFWNDLPDNLKQIDSRKRFKNETKEYLLRNYPKICVCTNPLCTDRKHH